MSHEPLPMADEVARIAEHAGLGLIRFDGRLRVSHANDAAHRALERRSGSLRGRTAMETFLDHRLEAMVVDASRDHASGVELLRSDRADLVARAHPASGDGVWVTLEDVTELERLRRIRSEFIDNLSHEIRTPLASVRLVTEMLMNDLAEAEVPDRVRERVATIDVETGHLVQLINELLDLSRMEQAATQMRHDHVALGPLVDSVLSRLRTFAERQRVSLVNDLSAHLVAIRGDEEHLERLLLNLLHNAVKYSNPDGSVTVTAETQPDEIIVSVRDEGLGIPLADQDRVFERFYKVDRARQRGTGGTGLGLAIARHIVQAHGGRIWLESREGEGSVFSFSLPRTAEA